MQLARLASPRSHRAVACTLALPGSCEVSQPMAGTGCTVISEGNGTYMDVHVTAETCASSIGRCGIDESVMCEMLDV